MELLLWLQNWFDNQCDGEWEHDSGITIETLDNPGWFVRINLRGTLLENKNFTTLDYDKGEDDWMCIKTENNCFMGFGDTSKLSDILKAFKCWSESENS